MLPIFNTSVQYSRIYMKSLHNGLRRSVIARDHNSAGPASPFSAAQFCSGQSYCVHNIIAMRLAHIAYDFTGTKYLRRYAYNDSEDKITVSIQEKETIPPPVKKKDI